MFAQADRVCIPRARENLQLKLIRSLPNGNEFVAFIDAVGEIAGLSMQKMYFPSSMYEMASSCVSFQEVPSGLIPPTE